MSVNTDDVYLEKDLGYKQKLFRGLRGYQNFALCFAQLSVAPAICAFTYGFALVAGGPATLVWAWIAAWFCSTFIAWNLAEICGAFPSCGSVYHWAAQLVPAEHSALASYIVGWLNLLANSTSDAIQAFGFANFLNAAITVSDGTPYNSEETVGVAIGILFLWSLIACLRVDICGHIGTLCSVIQFACLIIVPIALLVNADEYQSARWVFTQNNNYTGFDSQSYACVIGVVAVSLSYAGFDASAHISEETIDSKSCSPRNISLSVFFTGACGLFFILAFLFTTPSIDIVLSAPTTTASVNLFMAVCGKRLGRGLTWLLLSNFATSGFAAVTITGRISYALVRDNLFPFSEQLAEMHPTIKAPVYCLFATFLCDCGILLLCLDKTNGLAAYYSIVSLCSFGFFSSYIVPIVLKQVYFGPAFPRMTDDNLGSWSLPFACLSTVWLGGMIVLTFFPSFYPVKKENMNWEVVVVCGSALLIGINWFVTGRYNFKGPVRSKHAYGYTAVDTECVIEGLAIEDGGVSSEKDDEARKGHSTVTELSRI